ncbi:polynucleotide adenylyltransferase [Pseudomonas sp. CFBP 13719]|uniref:polynucleotide adenylyltransferase n=1 Tax=Pseudomonas sp. CFBP 13719 TaxID=2775303 RepID=UPI001785AAB5|nr:polynucleotide adenylyltransferase [Pseudomonas sp. CFBP 13719]MBD8681393.1 polynucleotide adenylyltransferase [Pseudomonas sp. CFBP 13719]
MRCYLVGGYVRDKLLGLDPSDQDYVVINESPDSMRSRGYTLVGNHFPVFLHPVTGEEYALARSEKSTGKGHSEFECSWEGVTLEEDLFRRDCTINAMAETTDGVLIDPYGGADDLESQTLRHVSPHFAEDPLRILRVARFAARLGFKVAPETLALMRAMVLDDMLETLPSERLWKETEKALLTDKPWVFFEVLDACGALERVFPELTALRGIPQRADYHSEGDAFVHTFMVFEEAALNSAKLDDSRKLRVRMAALLHDLGKSRTDPKHLWDEMGNVLGKHPGHEDPAQFEPLLDSLALRLKMPSYLRDFAYRVALVHQNVHAIFSAKGPGLVRIYERLDAARALRHDEFFLEDIAMACEADNYGRLILNPDGTTKRPDNYAQRDYFCNAMRRIYEVAPGPIIQEHMARGMKLESAKEKVVAAQRSSVRPMISEQRALTQEAREQLLGTRA